MNAVLWIALALTMGILLIVLFIALARAKTTEKHSNFNKLSDFQRRLLEEYFDAPNGTKVNELFRWDEFEEIFQTVVMCFTFRYQETVFSVFNYQGQGEFWLEQDEESSFQVFQTAAELLTNVTVNGRTLHEIWNQLCTA
ncbi:MAG: hypothetical protein ACI4QH_02610 [Candidatus Fimimonas sp.]